MTHEPAAFGTVLRQLRTAAALSQAALAERAGLSLRGVSDLERGVRRAPYLHTVRALADALELCPADRQALLAAARPGSVPEVPAGARAGPAPLPTPLTSLVGRERELATLVSLLGTADTRLVTLTGAGGTGKTRLALAVAEQLAEDFPDGVWFVGLAPVADPTLVVPSVAQVLGVREAGREPLTERVRAYLSNQHLLLVLDNFEPVVAAAPLVADLLEACSSLKVLVTSREPLHVRGERQFAVPPLALPDANRLPDVAALSQIAAVRLFTERARDVRADFTLTTEIAPAIAEICQRLDGLPLALELAAARIKILSPAALLARLDRRLPLLTGGARDLPQRQQTLRNTIAWSYDLLTAEEQALFAQLAVFAGGWTSEAAEVVTNPGGTLDVLEGMSSLVDKSLVRQVDQPDSEPRFTMLETIREFALERLAAGGETASLRARHAAYFAALTERVIAEAYASIRTAAARQFALERPNMRAALAWETEHGSNALLLRLSVAGWWYREPAEGYRILERALAATAPAAARCGERALLLASMGEMAVWLGYGVGAIDLLEESLALSREANDPQATALALLWLAGALAGQWELDRAEALATEALARWQAMPDRGQSRIGDALYILGYIASLRGDQAAAEARFLEALDWGRALGADLFAAVVLEALGTCVREQGNPHHAANLFAESLTIVRAGEDPLLVINCVKSLGAVAAVTDRPEQAARLFGASEALRERQGLVLEPTERSRLERAIAPARAGLSEAKFAAAWADGRALPMAQAIAEALALADTVVGVET
jgi:predicted ATPase/DNA-binding XRE family transcriptional regulator